MKIIFIAFILFCNSLCASEYTSFIRSNLKDDENIYIKKIIDENEIVTFKFCENNRCINLGQPQKLKKLNALASELSLKNLFSYATMTIFLSTTIALIMKKIGKPIDLDFSKLPGLNFIGANVLAPVAISELYPELFGKYNPSQKRRLGMALRTVDHLTIEFEINYPIKQLAQSIDEFLNHLN